jgi:surface-anchored protein
VSGSLAAALAVTGLNTSAYAVTLIDRGHVAVLHAEGDRTSLDLNVHDDTNDITYEPGDIVFSVPKAAKITNPGYGFLGTGSQVWLLPENQPEAEARGVLEPTVSTERVGTGLLDNDVVSFRLVSATRNGTATEDFSVYAGDGKRWFDSNPAITTFKSRNFAVGTHAHAKWAFEEAGTYQLTFALNASVGGASKTVTKTYTFLVTN